MLPQDLNWFVFFQVHIRSSFIMNGVCVRWRGWIDLERLDGVGCLEYNEERALQEDALLREQIERYNQRLREFEDKQRVYRQQDSRTEQDLEVFKEFNYLRYIFISIKLFYRIAP